MSGAAVILAGGKSTRLGRDKASELLLGRSLLQRAVDAFAGLVEEYVVVTAVGQTLPPIEATTALSVVEDAYPESGPLGGIYTGLRAMSAPSCVVVACDMPLLQPALLQELLRLSTEHELVVPMHDGKPEPLCAGYAKACLGPIGAKLDVGDFRVMGIFDDVATHYVEPKEWQRFDAQALSFQNLNRQADLERIEGLLRARASGI